MHHTAAILLHIYSFILVCTVILDEGVAESVIEEIIDPDEPPLYEAPPDYQSVLKIEKRISKRRSRSSSRMCKQ